MRPHDLPEHKLDSAKSPLYPSAPRRVKRTYITNQMKRVQGDESPWRSLGRPPLIGAGRVFVIPECPSLRKTHPHRESNEESPGRRVSLAQVWGGGCAASAFCPSVLPAENAAKPI